MTKTLYLAGTMVGFTYEEAKAWRDEVVESSRAMGLDFHFLSPLRGKEGLAGTTITTTADVEAKIVPIASPKAILQRDSHDVTTSDGIIVNFLGVTTLSIGTLVEIGISYGNNPLRPVFIVADESTAPILKEHLFLTSIAYIYTPSLECALIAAQHFFFGE